jgi:hypothetical protein
MRSGLGKEKKTYYLFPMIYFFYYKLTCLAVGLTVIVLGYFLFMKGLYKGSGDLEGSWKDYKIAIRKAAPGTYFVIFGSLIISHTLYKGFESEEYKSLNSITPTAEVQKSNSTPVIIDTLPIK